MSRVSSVGGVVVVKVRRKKQKGELLAVVGVSIWPDGLDVRRIAPLSPQLCLSWGRRRESTRGRSTKSRNEN